MKKIGIVGGISWLSTVEYYAGICRLAEKAHLAAHLDGAPAVPEIVIESLDLRRAIATLGKDRDEDSWREFDRYHTDALKRLENSGADFALIASNTAHNRFPSISKGIGIPVLNLFDELAAAAATEDSRDVLILGTALTMASAPLIEAFQGRGIHAGGPADPSVREATTRLIADLHAGNDAGSLKRLETIIATELGARPGRPPTVCLACTDLTLVFGSRKGASSFEHGGLTFLDSTAVHFRAAYQVATGERSL
jgi:aspartate racemase